MQQLAQVDRDDQRPRLLKAELELLDSLVIGTAKRCAVPAGKALVDRLTRAAEDGLDPADYPLARLAAGEEVEMS